VPGLRPHGATDRGSRTAPPRARAPRLRRRLRWRRTRRPVDDSALRARARSGTSFRGSRGWRHPHLFGQQALGGDRQVTAPEPCDASEAERHAGVAQDASQPVHQSRTHRFEDRGLMLRSFSPTWISSTPGSRASAGSASASRVSTSQTCLGERHLPTAAGLQTCPGAAGSFTFTRARPSTISSPGCSRTPRGPGGTAMARPPRATLVPCSLPSS